MLEDVDEPASLLIAPIEFMFKPIAPRAAELPYDLFALGQAAANLDHVLDGLPAKMVDRRGVTGQGQVVVGTCGRAVGSVTGHPIVLLGFADRENEKREAPVSWPGFRMSGGGGCAFGCLLLCGGFGRVLGCCLLSRTPPLGGRLVAYECARADVHHGRPPTLAPHFVELVFRNTVQAANLFDRHCE